MIKFENVSKSYGDTHALDAVGFELAEPGIYCLLGRNGAGKTTLLKCLAGHINATAGEITVNGARVNTLNMPPQISFIEAQGKLFNFKIKDLIKYSAHLSDNFDREFAKSIVEKFKLDVNKRYRQLSFGMKTMVSTLLSLASSADIIILDEPVLGLDAIVRDRFYTLLQESLASRPRIIIVSTHLIDEMARVTERVLVIDKGKLLDYFNIAELDEKGYTITGMTDAVTAATAGLRVIGTKTMGGLTTASIFDRRIAVPKGCTMQAIGLQDYFIALVGGDENEQLN